MNRVARVEIVLEPLLDSIDQMITDSIRFGLIRFGLIHFHCVL